MKTLHRITLSILILGTVICCHQNKDDDYFNGEIRYIDETHKIVKNIVFKTVPFDVLYYDAMISVYDSLLIVWNANHFDCFYSVFNVDTGREFGSFCPRGRGPREALSVNPVYQFFKKGSDIMTLLDAFNEQILLYWNISQSIKKGVTQYDTIISYKREPQFSSLYYLAEDTVLIHVQSIPLGADEATSPSYQKRTISTDELLRDYPIYKKKSVRKGSAFLPPIFFFYSRDVLKPDDSKIVQAMGHLPQINIIDICTGDVIGYRMKNGPDFSLFETDMRSMIFYYQNVQADDNYIYALYYGKEHDKTRSRNIIHIFDWYGKQIYELVTDRFFSHTTMWLDPVRNRLYFMADTDECELIYLDLNELNALQ